MRSGDAVLARLERLEAENSALRRRVDELAAPSTTRSAGDPLTRRDMLRRAGRGAAAMGLGVLGASMLALTEAGPALANQRCAIVWRNRCMYTPGKPISVPLSRRAL